ncbi:BgTH12-03454 [Blumeria graminis f. sp. triticale]|uniref:BgTH12-03454 n=1 Tax=Blumeria graminis f. sp. triticale TaxID=1689686 RepID=A0A9W4DCI6_BLUGR|nr:BgTH12-03454 [Blumeria graminis f. sp. triticale]
MTRAVLHHISLFPFPAAS